MRLQFQYLIHRRPASGTALAALIGVCAFGLAFAFLRFDGLGLLQSLTPTPQMQSAPETAAPPPTQAGASAAAGIMAGHVGVGIRLNAESVPLASLHVGAVLDVLASLPAGPDGPALVGPAVTGARVAALVASSDHADVLLEAPASEAVMLAYLVRSGSSLTYTVREVAAGPHAFPVLTIDQTRARLALPPVLVPLVTTPTTPTDTPPGLEVSEIHFIVYPGVDLAYLERRFGVSAAALSAANPSLVVSEPLLVGTELVVPDLYGFYYSVQPDDTFAGISQRYHLSIEQLRRLNDLLPEDRLPVGEQLLIPVPRPV